MSPELTVMIQVDASLKRLIAPDDAIGKAVRDRVAQQVVELLDVLGVPGEAQVEIVASRADDDRWMRVVINGRRCGYSDQLVQRVLSYVNGVVHDPYSASSDVLAWLTASEDVERVSGFVGLLCREAIVLQPDVLLGVEQLNAYREMLPVSADASTWFSNVDTLHAILSRVLRLRISLADRQAVAAHLDQAQQSNRSIEDTVEDVVAALLPQAIEVRLPADELYDLTTRYADDEHDEFVLLRDGLFYELGLRYPEFRFTPASELGANSFAFTINHVRTLPRIGLRADQCLVNDSVERLRLIGIDAVAAANPANRNEAALIALADRDKAERAGLNTWDQLGYLVLCLSSELRAHSICFVDRGFATRCLDQLSHAFPDLVGVARDQLSVEQITRVFRALVAEEISIRNMRRVLEQVINFDFIIADPGKYIIFDDRLPIHETIQEDVQHLAAYARMGMSRYISHKYTRGQNTLIVYLLDPAIEQRLATGGVLQIDGTLDSHLSASEQDAIVNAVRAEAGALPAGTSMPTILTSIDARLAMRSLIAAELPYLPVLAYNELAPDLNIQPIARIELSD